MDRLKKYCEKYLKDNLAPDNAVKILILAVKNESSILEEDCLYLIGE